MALTLHVGDIGAVLEMQIFDETGATVDVSTATSLQIIFRRPDDSEFTVTAALVNGGTTGVIRYVTPVIGTLNLAGSWQWQAHVVLDADNNFHTDVARFTVAPNLV